MRSKVGIHAHAIPGDRASDYLVFVAEGQPAAILFLSAPEPWAREALTLSPQTVPIQRKYCEHQPLTHPKKEAEALSSALLASSLYPLIAEKHGYWLGYCEIAGHDPEERKRHNEMEWWMAEYAHRAGVLYACLSVSVGRYHIDLSRPDPLYEWEDYYPCMRKSDAVSSHLYNAPRVNDQRDFDGGHWWRIRRPETVRKFLPDDLLDLPWMATEGIIDSGASGGPNGWDAGAQGGWQSFMSPEEHLADIKWFDEWMQKQDWMLWMLLFGWGTEDPTWDTYDPSKGQMYHLLLNYLRDHNRSVDLDAPEFRRWLVTEAQDRVIPYNAATAFRQVQLERGWDEALTDEFYPVAGVVAQVFLSGIDSDAEQTQHIIFAEVGKWDQYRVIDNPN